MKNKLILSAAVYTEKGLIRDSNEDNFYFNGEIFDSSNLGSLNSDAQYKDGEGVFVVCDGMGGDQFGQKASFEVVNSFKDFVKTIDKFGNVDHYAKRINKFISDENEKIFKMAVHYPDLRGMGTTFASLIIKDRKAIAMNIGDSRVYHYRNGRLDKLTVDHTEAERMVRLGILTRDEARNHIKRYILSRYIGLSPLEGKVEADVSDAIDIENGDIFIVSSDGLNEMVDERKISEVLKYNATAKSIGKALIEEARQSGGKDDITFLIVKVHSENENLMIALDENDTKDGVLKKEDYSKKAGFMSVVEKAASREFSKFDSGDITFSREEPQPNEHFEEVNSIASNRRMTSETPNNGHTGRNSEAKDVKGMDFKKIGILFAGIMVLAVMSYVLTFLFGKLTAYSNRFSTEQTQIDESINKVASEDGKANVLPAKASTGASTGVKTGAKTPVLTNAALAGMLSNSGGDISDTPTLTPTPTLAPTFTPTPKPTATNTPTPKPTRRPRPTNGPVSVTIAPENEPIVEEKAVSNIVENSTVEASQDEGQEEGQEE